MSNRSITAFQVPKFYLSLALILIRITKPIHVSGTNEIIVDPMISMRENSAVSFKSQDFFKEFDKNITNWTISDYGSTEPSPIFNLTAQGRLSEYDYTTVEEDFHPITFAKLFSRLEFPIKNIYLFIAKFSVLLVLKENHYAILGPNQAEKLLSLKSIVQDYISNPTGLPFDYEF